MRAVHRALAYAGECNQVRLAGRLAITGSESRLRDYRTWLRSECLAPAALNCPLAIAFPVRLIKYKGVIDTLECGFWEKEIYMPVITVFPTPEIAPQATL